MSSFSEKKSEEFYNAAAVRGNLELVKSLSVDREVNLNWQNEYGWTPFFYACQEGHVEVVHYLLDFHDNHPREPIDYNVASKNGVTPFLVACLNGYEKVVEMLLEDDRIDVSRANEDEETPLWWASCYGNLGVVKRLLASTREINILKGSEGVKKQLRREFGFPEVSSLAPKPSPIISVPEKQQGKVTWRRKKGKRDPFFLSLRPLHPAAQNIRQLRPRRKGQAAVTLEERQHERGRLLEKIKGRTDSETIQSMSKCSICLEELKTPKTLPCLHSFCLECLQTQTQKSSPPHRCGLCTAPFQVPAKGLSSLETSPLLSSMMSSSSSSSSSTAFDPNNVKCELCEDNEEATFHCGECDQFLGQKCAVTHRKSKSSSHHHLQSVDDYFSAAGGTKATTKRVSRCQEHPAQELDTYCKTCKVILCTKCLAATHSGHQFCQLGEESERLKGELIDLTATIAVREKEAEKGIKTFVGSLGKLSEERKAAGEDLAKTFASLHAELDCREAELVMVLEDREQEVKKAIQLEKEETEFAFAEFKGYREMSEGVLAGGTDVEVALGHSVLMSRGKTLDEIGFLSEPSEKGGVKFEGKNLAEVKKAISSFGNIQ